MSAEGEGGRNGLHRKREIRLAVIFATSAHLIYGIMPIYMKLLTAVPPGQIMAHRVIWSVLLLAGIALAVKRWGLVWAAFRRPRIIALFAIAALLIGTNWLLYIWAVLHNYVLETSLGFFITPLMTVLLGVVALRERLSRLRSLAMGLAVVGVAALAIGQGGTLWIALVLALTFSVAGLIRKVVSVDPLSGLLIETSIMAPIAIGWLWWISERREGLFGADLTVDVLLVLTGVVTAVPLLLFTAATKRMDYSLAGQFQYIGPTLQFLQAVLLFNEPFGLVHLFTFVCIWTGLGIYTFDVFRTGRKAVPIAEATSAVPK